MTRRTCLAALMLASTASIAEAEARPRAVIEMDSKRFEYHWRLPVGWEFTEPDRKGLGLPTSEAAEVAVARLKSTGGPMAILIATEQVSSEPGDSAEQYGRMKLGLVRATSVRSERVSVAGVATTRVSGLVPSLSPPFRSITVVQMGRRKFEIVCTAQPPPSARRRDPCGLTLAGLTVRPKVDDRAEVPRTLRLHGEALGIHYDPPEGWLGIGPRVGMGGAQKVWVWMLDGRQIDVQGLDGTAFPAYPNGTAVANQIATRVRAEGAAVKIGTEKYRGIEWTHLEISRETSGPQEDGFFFRADGVLYTIHVSQPTRDRSLLDRALAGFRLAAPGTEAVQPGVAPGGPSPRR